MATSKKPTPPENKMRRGPAATKADVAASAEPQDLAPTPTPDQPDAPAPDTPSAPATPRGGFGFTPKPAEG